MTTISEIDNRVNHMYQDGWRNGREYGHSITYL